MTALAATEQPAISGAQARLLAFGSSKLVWCALAILYFTTVGIGFGGAKLATVLGDTDDATRLLQVRTFLAGAGWYELTLGQLGGATPLLSHWSRLIDVPLALAIKTLSLFASPDKAELLARAYWPVTVLFVLLSAMAYEADKRAGALSAGVAIALAITSLTGLYQFAAGRIDHHNVMIAATIAGLLLATRSLNDARGSAKAGAVLGFGLVIGYEPLVLVVPLGALAALAAAWTGRWLVSLSRLLVAMTAVLAIGVLISRPPSEWVSSVCDAVSLNLVLLVGAGAAGMSILAAKGGAWSPLQRIGVLAAAGIAGALAYVMAEPSCLAGPYGAMNPEAKRIWLSGVIETQSIIDTVLLYPLVGIVFLIYAASGLAAAVHRARHLQTQEAVATFVVLVCAIIAALAQMKFVPYATFLAAISLAIFLATRTGTASLTPRAMAIVGVVLCNQIALSAVAIPLANRIEAAQGQEEPLVTGHGCEDVPSMQALNVLPPGLIAAQLNFGPFVAASSHHRAMAAPYHRIGDRMVDVHRIFRSTPVAAEPLLRASGAAYVLHCSVPMAPGRALGFGKDVPVQSLVAQLQAGQTPAYLDRVSLAGASPNLQVYRVRPR